MFRNQFFKSRYLHYTWHSIYKLVMDLDQEIYKISRLQVFVLHVIMYEYI